MTQLRLALYIRMISVTLILAFSGGCSEVTFAPSVDADLAENGSPDVNKEPGNEGNGPGNNGPGGDGAGPSDVPSEGYDCYTQDFTQKVEDEVKSIDILFVHDTSGSLDIERPAIADGIIEFVASLPQEVDYQVAVVHGHVGENSNWSGRLFQSKSGEPVVLSSNSLSESEITDGLRRKLVSKAQTVSDGGEAGLYSLNRLLTGERLDSAKAEGFFRSEAGLAVIFVSDENDICVPGQVADGQGKEGPAYQNYCLDPDITPATVYSQLKGVKGDSPLSVSGIVYSDPSTVPEDGENEIGLGYLDVISFNDGVIIDLAEGAIAEGLAIAGSVTADKLVVQTEFILEHSPVDPATIEVSVGNMPDVEHSFLAVVNSVHLAEENAGTPGAPIRISYCLQMKE